MNIYKYTPNNLASAPFQAIYLCKYIHRRGNVVFALQGLASFH